MRTSLVLATCTALALSAASGATAAEDPGVPAVAQGRVSTPEDHAHEDHVHHDLATEQALWQRTKTATSADAQAAAAATAGAPQDVGVWSPPLPWPVVAIHTALLPTGNVLTWDSVGDRATESFQVHDHTRATVWNPSTGTFTDVGVSGFNIFCAGLAHLIDGRIFAAGGNKDAALSGIKQTHVFDAAASAWTRGPDMTYERWYPSVTPQANGEMLITEGGPDTPEVRTTTGGLRVLTGATLNLPLYPWLDVAPDGRSFYSGPDNRFLSLNATGTGQWQSFGAGDGDRNYGSHAVYDIGRILVAGGGASRKDASVVDINGASPVRTATAPMAFGRRQHNLTLLADGSVLATGGNSSGASLVDLNAGVYAAERWDPASGQWTTMAAQRQTRQYHSTSLLLPDGRVLSAGGGICGTCDSVGYLAKDGEVFSPPYLFDATGAPAVRPTVSSVAGPVAYGGTFSRSFPDARPIPEVGLSTEKHTP